MAELIKGRRILDNAEFWMPGDYGRGDDGIWYARPPDPDQGLGNLSGHEVVEHPDGTITVSPSIAIDQGQDLPKWHGFLEAGYWRKA